MCGENFKIQSLNKGENMTGLFWTELGPRVAYFVSADLFCKEWPIFYDFRYLKLRNKLPSTEDYKFS